MELWIRSQDKKGLFKVNNVYVVDYNGYYYVASVIHGKEVKLGEYGFHTSTRALEILDEIQEAQLGNYHYRCPSNVKVSNNENTIVYEMPKE